jgi:hypothetical protein
MKPGSIDLKKMAELGRLSQSDAQGLHVILCNQEGVTDPDAVIALWNKLSPRARWNCPPEKCTGKYVRQLTDMTLRYMKDQVRKTRAKRKKKP